LQDLDIDGDVELTLVISRIPLVLTRSGDDTAKIWSCDSAKLKLEDMKRQNRVKGKVKCAGMTAKRKPCAHPATAGSQCCKHQSAAAEVPFGEHLKTLRGHTAGIRVAVFSPDGALVLTGSYDETAKIWSCESGECLKTLQGHTDSIYSAVFSPVPWS
jgi:WD40 repeat protein